MAWFMLCIVKILDVPQSGSQAGTTSSRNRFGQYRRTRAVPVNPATGAQGTVRARLSANAAAWRSLSDAQRAGWSDLATSMNRSDSLGQSYNLTGFLAYVSVNNNLEQYGSAALSDAPSIVTPGALLTATITLTAASFSVAYTATPIAASTKLLVFASPQRSAGRSFEGDYRRVFTSAAAAASPADIFAAYQAKFGTPVVGNRVFLSLQLTSGGFTGGPLVTSKVVA